LSSANGSLKQAKGTLQNLTVLKKMLIHSKKAQLQLGSSRRCMIKIIDLYLA
jgi:hypothetical protein